MSTHLLPDVRTGGRARMPGWSLVGLAVLLSAGLGGAVWVADHVQADASLHQAALFAHLASLVLGFGAVLSIDWVGLLWVLGRRSLNDVVATADHLQPPIWAGLAGLVVSGVLLEPDVTHLLTQVKLALVLAITWNGLLAGFLHRRLVDRAAHPRPSRLLIAISSTSAAISQAGWWGAMAIGFLNH